MWWRLALRISGATILPWVFATAHPLGNRSVSHLTVIEVEDGHVEATYVLELGEVPAYLLLKEHPNLEAQARDAARQWIAELEFSTGGRRLEPELESAEAQVRSGDDGLKVARITMRMRVVAAGSLAFEDHNFSDRSGWKEIAIRAGTGEEITRASQGPADRSKMLTEFQGDPPQDLRAMVEWKAGTGTATKIASIPQPPPVIDEGAPKAASTAKKDYLRDLLGRERIGFGLALAGLAAAFGLGAMHALSPGHGKTIVAAYLVGSKCSMRHAAFLGAMVTFTHTAGVFALGLVALFFSEYAATEKIARVLGVASGLSIVLVGAWLFRKRFAHLRHEWQHAHGHAPDHHHHDHDGHAHSHVPEGEVTMGSLMALGASGGLAPCPSALVLLLSAIALGRTGLGLVLLIAFSAGLAGVLMGIGMMVLYAKKWLPGAGVGRPGVLRWAPVISAVVIVCVGVVMTGASLGWWGLAV
jgi:nickel/cobalt transporter (NicO) family protein